MSLRVIRTPLPWSFGLVTGFLFLIVNMVVAEEVSTGDSKTDRVIYALQKKYKKVETCTSRLTTTIQMMGKKIQVQQLAAFKSPSRILLETEGEPKQTTVSNGGLLWIYNAQYKTVNRINLLKFLKSTGCEADVDHPDPTRPFRGLQRKTIRYVGSEFLGEKEHRVFDAVPRISLLQVELPIVLKKIRVYIYPDDGLMRRIEILDAFEKAVIIQQFDEMMVNPRINDSRFEFVVPSGTHVMDVTDDWIELLKSAEEKRSSIETPNG